MAVAGTSSNLPTEIEKQSTEPGIQITVQTGHDETLNTDYARLATQDSQPSVAPSSTEMNDVSETADHQVTPDTIPEPAGEISEPTNHQPAAAPVPTQIPVREKSKRERKFNQPFQVDPRKKTYK